MSQRVSVSMAKFFEWWGTTKWTSPRLKAVAREAWLQSWITRQEGNEVTKEHAEALAMVSDLRTALSREHKGRYGNTGGIEKRGDECETCVLLSKAGSLL